jgi:uncharacterized protein YbjT (DUF2867 family)
MIKKICVIGCTGMIGIPVTKELAAAGFEVKALVRDPEKAAKIFSADVQLVTGDLNNPLSLEFAMMGTDAAYINISTSPEDKKNKFNPELQGLDNILSAAKKTGIKRIVYISSLMARDYQSHWWVMQTKKANIAKIKQSHIPYTIFYPSNFMENFKNGMVRGNKITILGKPKHKNWWIAGTDFGRQVAASFKTENAINKEYPAQGPEAMDLNEAAQIYATYYTKEYLEVSNTPLAFFKVLSLFIYPLQFITNLMDTILNYVETFESQATWDELGTPQITIDKFAQRF